MKILASLFLFLFLALLAYPTYTLVVKKFADKNVSYAFSDEENEKESKELKELGFFEEVKLLLALDFSSPRFVSKISPANESKRTNFPREILIPPPKLV
jgi:hypothetical protein